MEQIFKNLFRALLLLIAVLSSTITWAYDFYSSDIYGSIYYNITSSTSVEVTFTNSSYDYIGYREIPKTVVHSGITYNVTGIGNNAFSGRYSLTGVKIPNSVTSIGNSAFNGCTGLTSVTIPNSVTSIGNSAFKGCTGLTSVTIPNSVTSIGSYAFDGCTGLNSVSWNAPSCSDFPGYTTGPFYSVRDKITNFSFGGEVERIPAYLCYGMSGLTSVTIPNSVTTIGLAAFYNCTSLGSVIIPNSVTSIGNSAFNGCTGLTSVIIGNSVTSIGNSAFNGCSGLTSVTIPNSLTSIGSYAFNGTSLTSINCNAVTPPDVTTDTFYGLTPSRIKLFIPFNTHYLYTHHSIWSQFWLLALSSGSTQGSGGFAGSGSGTESDPYLIFNPIQLYSVRNFSGIEGVVFRLMSDINLTEFLQDNSPTQGWEPIGVQESPFKGIFHGENHTISGLFINRQSKDFTGLFGFVENASIEDLTIECSSIKGNNYTGSVCGFAQQSAINNVTSTANVEGNAQSGGFVGEAFSTTISYCHHTGDVISSGNRVGGFGGALAGTVTSCSHEGNVSGQDYLGGFAGVNAAELTAINNTANIITGRAYTGGFVGRNSGPITNVTNAGTSVVGEDETGGFVGETEGATLNNIKSSIAEVKGGNCSGGFAGYTRNCTTANCNSSARVTGSSRIAGFAGQVNGLTATDCYSIGDITGNTHVGGFIGYGEGVNTTTKCGEIGNVKAKVGSDGNAYAAGFVGYLHNDGSTKTISNCFAVGDVTAYGSYIGGIAGMSWQANIDNSYFSGKLTGTSYVGGIIGSGSSNALSKNYANGSISGNQYVGGIAGYISTSSTIKSCVAAQDVINATNGTIGRVYGAIDATSSVGTPGTNEANRGMTTMNVVSQGQQLTVEDGEQHGTSIGKGLLKYKSTYQGINWDFSTDWTILETESYPYKPSQCAPPAFTGVLVSGGTSVTGKCASGASVYVIYDNNTYQATVNGTTWTATAPALQSGATVKAYAVTEELIQSYFVTATVGFDGDGTEDNPYLIYTADDLANINSYSYYKVMNDIDLTDWINTNSPSAGWLPVGKNGGGTMKQIDGDGHIISGLWINSTGNHTGLISSIENAIVKNLTIKVADGKMVKSTGDYVGIAVGKSTNSIFENVKVSGIVDGGNYVGGIAGYAETGSFSSCLSNNVVLTASGNYSGGIAGSGNEFKQCTVENISINGGSYVGGITSTMSMPMEGLKVKSTTISATGDYVGGIVGKTTKAITNCYADVSLTGKDYIGGITGHTSANIEICYSQGSVETTDLTNCRAGGIVGYTTGNITNCYSTADTRGGQYAGGIAGYSFGAINKCYSSGDLYATNFGGGIVGYLDGSNASVNNCFAINNKIDVSDQNGVAMRVIGGFKNGAPTPQANNYALKSMVVSVNDVTQQIYDDLLHGIGVTQNVLETQATYTAQGWDFTDTWGIDEGNGYPYLLALVEEETPEFTPGDVNDDGTINVYDYVSTASYILEKDPQPFVFAAADLDENLSITVSDLVGVAYLALTYEGAPMLASAIGTHEAASLAMDATISSTANGQYEVSINLSNNIALTAMQMDINLPEGMTLVDASLSDRASASHQVDFNLLASGDYRVLAASSTIKSFKNNDGTVLTLTLAGTPSGDGRLSNIVLASPDAESYSVDDITLNFNTTGVFDIYSDARIYREGGNIVIMAPCDSQAQIVMPNGMYKTVKVAAGRNVYQAPSTGMIIVRLGDVVKKMRF